ncbi:MAG TPA: hypothetical protein VL688_00680 [Verrucomicrobiae bacterium]|jgi:hypothetical protein|nr:hypothetical protein [Verrucomicrobiae bacterium]
MLNYKKKLLEPSPAREDQKTSAPAAPASAPEVNLDERLAGLRKDLLRDLEADLQTLKEKRPSRAVPSRFLLIAGAGLIALLCSLGGVWAGIAWMDARLKPDWQKEFGELERQASLKLDRFMTSREMQVLIEDKARSHAEDYAVKAADEQVGKILAPLSEKASQEIERLGAESSRALTAVQDLEAFELLVVQAKNDDRQAFERLLAVSRDRSHKFREIAGQAVAQIFLEADSRDRSARTADALDPVKSKAYLSFQDFKTSYEGVIPLLRPKMLSMFWDSTQFSEEQKLGFLASVIRSDKSLMALVRACTLMDKKAQLHRPFTAYDKYLEWWDSSKVFFEQQAAAAPAAAPAPQSQDTSVPVRVNATARRTPANAKPRL